MWDALQNNSILLVIVSVLVPLLLTSLLLYRKGGASRGYGNAESRESKNSKALENQADAKEEAQVADNSVKKKSAGGKKKAAAEAAAAAAEIDRFASFVLKGFADQVEDCASSLEGDTVAGVSGDRSIRLFAVPKDGDQTTIRTWTVSCGRSRATRVAFASESIVAAVTEGAIFDGLVAFEVSRNERGSTMLWEISGVFSASNNTNSSRIISLRAGGGILIACSEGTLVAVVEGRTGTVLSHIDSSCLRNSMATTGAASGKILGVSGFTSDVKLWHMPGRAEDSQTKKAHSHSKQTSRLGQLAGHKSRVSAIAFSNDETRAVSSSKDGTARVWRLDVRWDAGEDPRVIVDVATGLNEGYELVTYVQMPKPNQTSKRGEEVAVIVGAYKSTIYIIEASKSEGVLRKSHTTAHSGTITALQSFRTGCFFTAGADKRVRVWNALKLLEGS